MANAEIARNLHQNPSLGRVNADQSSRQKPSEVLRGAFSKLRLRKEKGLGMATNSMHADSSASGGSDSPSHEVQITSEMQYPILERKLEQRWELRPIQRQDVPRIAMWFRDPGVRDHIGEDRIDPFVPKNWDNVREVGKFITKLEEFYFPPNGKIKVELKTPPHQAEDGEIIPTTDPKNPKFLEAIQYTHVCSINGKLVGVQSWMNDDPYAPSAVRQEIDDKREKAAYGFVMITNPEYRRLHVATVMSFTRNDLVLGKDENNQTIFTHLSGLVTYTNGWNQIFEFFQKTLGYELDRDKDGHAVPQVINGKEISMWRMVLGRKKWWKMRDRAYAELESKMNPQEDETSKTI